jgi:Family of unknown function (DUF5519)
VPRAAAPVDEIASELDTWPGVRVESRGETLLIVSYRGHELGILDREQGVAQLRFASPERDALVEHGDAEPAEPVYDEENVSHDVRGPSDVSAVLELFTRRYRDLRGEDDPYTAS